MRHEFHPEAVLEFEEAVRFYKERGRNLGKRFAREIRTTIQKIVATPDRWRLLEEDVRRCLVRVFPYSDALHHRSRLRPHSSPSRTGNGSRAIGGIGCHIARRADQSSG